MAKPTKEDAREAIERLGLPPNRFGHYTVGDYKLKFLQRAIRVERRFKYESGGRLSACGPAQAGGGIRIRTYFYSKLVPGQLEGLVNLLKNRNGGHHHGNKEESSE